MMNYSKIMISHGNYNLLPRLIMSLEKFLMMGAACTWRYLIISLLLQRPIRLMMLWSIPEQRRDMAPSAQKDLEETS